MTRASLALALPELESPDQRVALHRISWAQYEALLRSIGESSAVRTTYLEGELELMSPGRRHEYVKTLLARLVEAFADARELQLNGFGSETFKRKAKKAGLEPDECYCVGPAKRIPDLAIEVVITSGGIEKLEVYRRLGFKEVWFWEEAKLAIFVLGPSGTYQRQRRSHVLRGFPVALVERLIDEHDESHQSEAVREFRKLLV
jgi:Uma2 family endonuclease